MQDQVFTVQRKTYRCDQGHEMLGENWSTLIVRKGDGSPAVHFNFCPFCWGEHAVTKWPMKEVSLIQTQRS